MLLTNNISALREYIAENGKIIKLGLSRKILIMLEDQLKNLPQEENAYLKTELDFCQQCEAEMIYLEEIFSESHILQKNKLHNYIILLEEKILSANSEFTVGCAMKLLSDLKFKEKNLQKETTDKLTDKLMENRSQIIRDFQSRKNKLLTDVVSMCIQNDFPIVKIRGKKINVESTPDKYFKDITIHLDKLQNEEITQVNELLPTLKNEQIRLHNYCFIDDLAMYNGDCFGELLKFISYVDCISLYKTSKFFQCVILMSDVPISKFLRQYYQSDLTLKSYIDVPIHLGTVLENYFDGSTICPSKSIGIMINFIESGDYHTVFDFLLRSDIKMDFYSFILSCRRHETSWKYDNSDDSDCPYCSAESKSTYESEKYKNILNRYGNFRLCFFDSLGEYLLQGRMSRFNLTDDNFPILTKLKDSLTIHGALFILVHMFGSKKLIEHAHNVVKNYNWRTNVFTLNDESPITQTDIEYAKEIFPYGDVDYTTKNCPIHLAYLYGKMLDDDLLSLLNWIDAERG